MASVVVFIEYIGEGEYDTLKCIKSNYSGYGQGFNFIENINRAATGRLCVISNPNLGDRFDYDYTFVMANAAGDTKQGQLTIKCS